MISILRPSNPSPVLPCSDKYAQDMCNEWVWCPYIASSNPDFSVWGFFSYTAFWGLSVMISSLKSSFHTCRFLEAASFCISVVIIVSKFNSLLSICLLSIFLLTCFLESAILMAKWNYLKHQTQTQRCKAGTLHAFLLTPSLNCMEFSWFRMDLAGGSYFKLWLVGQLCFISKASQEVPFLQLSVDSSL